MKKIKVLWIITNGIKRNGICVSQLDYFKLINKEKFLIDVVAVHNNTKEMIEAYRNAGCRVFELPDRRKDLSKYLRQLKKLIISERYDIVHVHGSSALMALELGLAKRCKVPVRIAHSRNTTCDQKKIDKLLRPVFKKQYNVALACGEDAGKWLFKNNYFCVFHNGKNFERYMFNEKIRQEYRKKLKIKDKIAIGHVGLFDIQKNHEFLIDIFKKIHRKNENTYLFLFGFGDKMNYIKSKVNSLNLNDCVFFLGSVNNISDYLQAMDVMLFPSLFEGLPNVVIEWQIAGLPCIISDKITKECGVSNLVNFLPIDNVNKWVNFFENIKILSNVQREKKSKEACELLKEKGFEIKTNTRELEKIYINKVKEFGS